MARNETEGRVGSRDGMVGAVMLMAPEHLMSMSLRLAPTRERRGGGGESV